MQIDKLLYQLGEANRQLIDAVESDESRHTVRRGDYTVRQEQIVSDFVRGPRGEA